MKERIEMAQGSRARPRSPPPTQSELHGQTAFGFFLAPPKYVHGNDEGLIIELLLLMSFYPPPVGGGDRSRILSHVSPGRRPA